MDIDRSKLITAKDIALSAANIAARKLLAETDWYVSRYGETGIEIPKGVLTARAAARKNVIKEEAKQ